MSLTAATPAPAAEFTACFSVVSQLDPGGMPRVLALFAKRGLVPTYWFSRVSEQELTIDMQMEGLDRDTVAPGNFLDWSTLATSFESMAAWQDGSGASALRGEDDALVVETVKVTPSFFRVLGAPPLLGRTFDAARERGAR